MSIAFNFFIAKILHSTQNKIYLILGVVCNLGILIYFKYLGFLLDAFRQAFHVIPKAVELAIPLGISFYTFQQIAYLVDVYKKKTKTFKIRDYALFVTFFPQLIAGPIVHYSEIMPQFSKSNSGIINYKNCFNGILFFLVGLFQKVVIADNLSPMADVGFLNAGLLSCVEAWVTLLSYSLQIYFDFAGYSNMAIGLALFFNIKIPINFNSPYKAISVIDFWKRWHMTLTQFLRDYVYIPLGGNRIGNFRKFINIFLTMLLGGVWHGAGWTYIIWGAYHGILIVLNHLSRSLQINISKFVSGPVTFICIVYGWVFFKSQNMAQAIKMSRNLFSVNTIHFSSSHYFGKFELIFLFAVLTGTMILPNIQYFEDKIQPNKFIAFIFLSLFILGLLFLNRESAFLYFQF